MADFHRETAAFGGDAVVARGARFGWQSDGRAIVLLAYVVAGAALIVTSVEPMTLTLIGLLAGPEPSDLGFEIVARLGVGLSIMGLALIGLLVTGAWPPARIGPALVTGTALPAGMVAVALVLASAWLGGVAIARPHGGVADGGLFVTGTLLILLGVIGEELLVRGLLQPALVRAWGPAAGVLLSSLAFMSIHMVGGWGHPVSLLNIWLAGIWFGLLALRTGGLAAPILAHFGYNWAEEMIFGASPNPGIGAFGSVIDVDLAGRTIWGGSVEGLNASLAVSIVLAALIVPLAIAGGQRHHTGGSNKTDGATARL